MTMPSIGREPGSRGQEEAKAVSNSFAADQPLRLTTKNSTITNSAHHPQRERAFGEAVG